MLLQNQKKSWVNDPNGVAWEAYHTMEDAEIYNTAGARSDTEKKVVVNKLKDLNFSIFSLSKFDA